jgi:ElaB/YqjD/DUF883 family membrane-anchored ribosome-binding protein
MTRRKKPTRSSRETIQEELATIGADVASLANTLGDVASAEAQDTIKSIRERLDRVAGDAGSATRAGVGMVQDSIEENPFLSVAVAFGVGMVLASMLRR